MEPQELVNNDETSGFSKRRISSILKAPRRSVRFPHPEQQTNVVECVKTVEKRPSRRVSFAPANDVLLFSKDMKNASPTRSPLQELMTATGATTPNRVPGAEDGSQHLKAMETLLNAPLHGLQEDKVHFDMVEGLGDKTVVFSSEDVMDMTHSQTINFESYGEFLAEGTLPSDGKRMVMFTADDASMSRSHTVNLMSGAVSRSNDRQTDLNVPSTLASLDPGFDNFLASLSKSGGPSSLTSVESTSSLAHIKEKKDVDKENQLPASVPSVMEKLLTTSRKSRQVSYESVLCLDDDVSMDLTEVQPGRTLGFSGTYDPFQCLFPTEDMYVHSDKRGLQAAVTSSDPKAVAAADTRVQKVFSENGKGQISDVASLKNLNASHQRHKLNCVAREEKTIMFSTDEELMDMTQSHTVNISRGSLAPRQTSANGLDSGFENFLSGLSKPTGLTINPVIERAAPSTATLSQHKTPRAGVDKANRLVNTDDSCSSAGRAVSPVKDVGMDITECQTGRIIEMAGSDDPFHFLFPTQDMYPQSESLKKTELTSGQKNSEAWKSSHNTGVDTSSKRSLNKQQRHQFDADNASRHKVVDDTHMEVTQSHTVHIRSDLKMPSNHNSLSCKDKTVKFNFHDGGMDLTQCLTINIDHSLDSDPFLPPANDKTMRFNAQDAGMDMTKCLTVDIANLGTDSLHLPLKHEDPFFPPTNDKTMRFDAHDAGMDMTKCLTVNIAKDLISNPLKSSLKEAEVDAALLTRDKTVRFDAHDAGMDMTKCMTVNIANNLGSDSLHLPLKKHDVDPSVPPTNDKTMTFDVHDAGMDMTKCLTVNIANSLGSDSVLYPVKKQEVHPALLTTRDKTMRFDAHDAGMDMTQCLTVNIANDLVSNPLNPPLKKQEVDSAFLATRDKMKFDVHDDGMDMTQCLTVNVANNLGSDSLSPPLKEHERELVLLPTKDKTLRFDVHDAGMDMTKCLTVNIANTLDSDSLLPAIKKQEVEKSGISKGRSSTAHGLKLEFNSFLTEVPSDDPVSTKVTSVTAPSFHTGDSSTVCPDVDVNMDRAEVQTDRIVGIAYTDGSSQCRLPRQDLNPQSSDLRKGEMTSQLQINEEPASTTCKGMETSLMARMLRHRIKIDAGDDAATNRQCPSVNISRKSDLVLPNHGPNLTFSHGSLDLYLTGKTTQRSRSLSARGLELGFKNAPSRTSRSRANPLELVAPAPQNPPEGVGTGLPKLDVDALNVTPSGPSDMEMSPNKTMAAYPEIDVGTDMAEVHTGHDFGHTCSYDVSPSSTPDPDPNCDLVKQRNATSQQNNEAVETCKFRGSVDSNEITRKEREARNETTISSSQKIECSPTAVVDQVADPLCSRRSRRMSLADLQSKARRLSHIINTAPDTLAAESCTTPVPQWDHDLDKTSQKKNKSLPVVEPELEVGLENPQDSRQGQHLNQGGEPSAATTPFNLKTKLMSRISMGGFKPKLPQKSSTNNQKRISSGEPTRTVTVNMTGQLRNLDNDVSDIFDEELGSCEDMSEILDPQSPLKLVEKERDVNFDEPLEEDVFGEVVVGAVQGKKRPIPEDENNMEDQKRRKASTQSIHDVTDMELQSDFVEGDCNTATAQNTTTHTTDCSNSSHTTATRCEATFESTFKQSLFESQLEDYTCDIQKKLDTGSITVLEFFKLFNIDFVIHNPRQSVLPGKLLSDAEQTPIDVLKDRHISRPKQKVYEKDVLDLTEKVEGLKVRMRDLDKPLKMVNKALWEEMRNSSEKELKSFGASLKVRNNFFRKMSKAQSHEMKEVLYSNLVQSNLEEQQKLKETIAKADEMIKSLDDCICELESEIATVENKGLLDKPSLKSQEEEMKKVTQALADNEREMAELELQEQQNSSKLKRTKSETRNLEEHVTLLDLINEWKVSDQDNCTVFTFLHDTVHLQLVYEKSTAASGGDQSDRKITGINFTFQLNDEKSQCHARLVHKLISQYIKSEPRWMDKYPTKRYVPKLLHDVSLVVSRCRLLGEELRLLKMWGGLKLDILDISCLDTRVLIVFSSLKKSTKFEVILSISLINQQCVIHLDSCKNLIGNTEIQRIKEIVASFSPAMNVLTKIVKKIHEHLLC